MTVVHNTSCGHLKISAQRNTLVVVDVACCYESERESYPVVTLAVMQCLSLQRWGRPHSESWPRSPYPPVLPWLLRTAIPGKHFTYTLHLYYPNTSSYLCLQIIKLHKHNNRTFLWVLIIEETLTHPVICCLQKSVSWYTVSIMTEVFLWIIV